MAKLAYVCLRDVRNAGGADATRRGLLTTAARIHPDHLAPTAPAIHDASGLVFALFSPNDAAAVINASVCLGGPMDGEEWATPGTERPDGTYAIVRGSASRVEVLTDATATRTLWYYMDEERFIAATSQRAIVILLQDFQPDPTVLPWVLSTGTLGPEGAWDRRLRRLPPNATLSLDRRRWTLDLQTDEAVFTPDTSLSTHEHKKHLWAALSETFGALRLDLDKWVLPLSGGYDSRAIACLLGAPPRLRTITWGLTQSQQLPDNDAWIARCLATELGLEHEYHATDLSDEPVDVVFERFVACGEGRIDHIAGYMDGMTIWKRLHENSIRGIIRGDEGFGWVPVANAREVRSAIGMPLLADFSNLGWIHGTEGMEQTMPQLLERRPGETLASWRDRLYHTFRIPVVLAALSDIKLPYVEIINPLLSRRVVQCVRTLPDSLRTNKHLFREIVRTISPPVAYATYEATARPGDLLRSPHAMSFLRDELTAAAAASILPGGFAARLADRMSMVDAVSRRRLSDIVKPKRWTRPRVSRPMVDGSLPTMDLNLLAFRTWIAVRMHHVLEADVRANSRGADRPPNIVRTLPKDDRDS